MAALCFRAVLLVLLVVSCTSAAVPSAPAGTPRRPLGPRDVEYTLRHDNVVRTYVLHAPPGAETKIDLPVVLVLWDNGSADSAIAQSGWSQKADAEGFLVAYVQADRGLWNDGSRAGLAGRVKNGDIGLLGAVFGDVARIEPGRPSFKIDPKRLHVAGFGNGGSVAWLAAVEIGHRIASAAAVGGHFYSDAATLEFGTSFLYLVGTADAQYPIDGGNVLTSTGAREVRPPLQQTIDRWLRLMSCGASTLTGTADVRVAAYRGCQGGHEAVVQTVAGLAHAWPGALLGGVPAPDQVRATDVLWEFFRAHPRR